MGENGQMSKVFQIVQCLKMYKMSTSDASLSERTHYSSPDSSAACQVQERVSRRLLGSFQLSSPLYHSQGGSIHSNFGGYCVILQFGRMAQLW